MRHVLQADEFCQLLQLILYMGSKANFTKHNAVVPRLEQG
jgi:hypothetical protein